MYVLYAFEWLGSTFMSLILTLDNIIIPISDNSSVSLFGVLLGVFTTSFAIRQLGKFVSNKERA